MGIRTQNLLFIVPIFLGLAILNSLLSYREEVAEINWGMAEGLEALTIAAAEFIDAEDCRRLEQGGEPSAALLERLRTPLQRIARMDAEKRRINLKQQERNRAWIWVSRHLWDPAGSKETQFTVWESLRRISILAPDGRRVLFQLNLAAQDQAVHLTLPEVVAAAAGGEVSLLYRTADDRMVAMRRDGIRTVADLVEVMRTRNAVYTGVFPDVSGRSTAASWAPILGRTGEPVGILRVEVDAAPLAAQKRLARVKTATISGGIILLGALASVFISGVITGRIRELNRAASEAVAGDYQRRVQLDTIQEMIDLGNTFNTTTSVLEEVLSRTRRELIDGEQFRNEEDLARTYRDIFWEPQEGVLGGVEVAARLVSHRPTGDFCGAFEAGGRAYAVLGRVRMQADLDAVTLASAALSFVRQGLAGAEPELVFAELCEVFEVETWKCVLWRADDAEARWLARDLQVGTPMGRGAVALVQNECLVFHSLEAGGGARADSFASLFKHLPPGRLAEDLVAVLAEPSHGAVIAVARRGLRTVDCVQRRQQTT